MAIFDVFATDDLHNATVVREALRVTCGHVDRVAITKDRPSAKAYIVGMTAGSAKTALSLCEQAAAQISPQKLSDAFLRQARQAIEEAA